jgi:hypothetical protein
MKDAVALFFAMATQWRWVGAGMGGVIRTGLDYCALAKTADMADLNMTPGLFNDIRTLELAALDGWSKGR